MADYTSLKVPELKKLLSERSLTVNGNKADLIARLQDHDKTKATAEDEIDWDDEQPAKVPATAATATTTETAAPAAEEAAAPTTAGEITETPADAPAAETPTEAETETEAPAAVGDAPATAAATTTTATATDALVADGAADTPSEPVPGLSQHLAATDGSEEAKKRAARAKRFGLSQDDELSKKTERAERFGIEAAAVEGLDAALPDRPRKRAAAEGAAAENGRNKRATPDRRDGGRDGRRGRRGGDGRRNGNRDGNRDGNRNGRTTEPARKFLDDPIERKKAEERAKRFAA